MVCIRPFFAYEVKTIYIRVFSANMGLIWADRIGGLLCSRVGGEAKVKIFALVREFRCGRTTGRTKWTDNKRVGGRTKQGCGVWDREGEKYRFFNDRPEK